MMSDKPIYDVLVDHADHDRRQDAILRVPGAYRRIDGLRLMSSSPRPRSRVPGITWFHVKTGLSPSTSSPIARRASHYDDRNALSPPTRFIPMQAEYYASKAGPPR